MLKWLAAGESCFGPSWLGVGAAPARIVWEGLRFAPPPNFVNLHPLKPTEMATKVTPSAMRAGSALLEVGAMRQYLPGFAQIPTSEARSSINQAGHFCHGSGGTRLTIMPNRISNDTRLS